MKFRLIISALLIFAILIGIVPAAGEGAPSPTPSVIRSDEESPVMYFWSEDCTYCQKQRIILDELSIEGLWVKYMDAKANPDFLQKYNLTGIPTFDGFTAAGNVQDSLSNSNECPANPVGNDSAVAAC